MLAGVTSPVFETTRRVVIFILPEASVPGVEAILSDLMDAVGVGSGACRDRRGGIVRRGWRVQKGEEGEGSGVRDTVILSILPETRREERYSYPRRRVDCGAER